MTPDQISPIHDQVLIRRDVDKTVSEGGLFIPETAQREGGLKPGRGTVLKVGPGLRDKHDERIPMEVEIGDFVIFSRLSGDTVVEIVDDEPDVLLIRESEIWIITKRVGDP